MALARASVALRAVRAAPRLTNRVSRRFASEEASGEELAETSNMWFKVSIATVAAVVLPFTAYMYVVESSHEHHEKKLYPHMKIRVKQFPWADKDCDFLDKHCIEHSRSH